MQQWVVALPDGESDNRWPRTPVIEQGMVIIGARGGLAAFDTASGTLKWQANIFGSSFRTWGAIASDSVRACLQDSPAIGCVDIRTGRVLWTAKVDSSTTNFDAALDTFGFYIGTSSHIVYAFDPVTGAIRWRTDVTPEATSLSRVFGTAVSGDTVYATTVRWTTQNSLPVVGDLVALDRATGATLWRYTTPGTKGGFQGAALVTARLAIMNDPYAHSIVAIDRFSQKEVWRTAVDSGGYISAETPPALVGDTLVVSSTDTQIHAIDLRTGTELWKVRTDLGSMGSGAVCGRFALAVEFGGGRVGGADRTSLAPFLLESVPREVVSRIGTAGKHAYFVSSSSVYSYTC